MRGPTASVAGATVYGDGWARRDVVRDDTVMTDDESGGGRRRSETRDDRISSEPRNRRRPVAEDRPAGTTSGRKQESLRIARSPRIRPLAISSATSASGCRRRSHAPPNPETLSFRGSDAGDASAFRARTYINSPREPNRRRRRPSRHHHTPSSVPPGRNRCPRRYR